MFKLCRNKVNSLNQDGAFGFEGQCKKLDTGESITLNYMPFGVGITFNDDEIAIEDATDSFSFKPTLLLSSEFNTNQLSYKTCKLITDVFLQNSRDDVFIVMDSSHDQIAYAKINGVIRYIEPFDEDDSNIDDGIQRIVIAIDIPIFGRDIQQIKENINDSFLELDGLIYQMLHPEKINQ